MIVTRRRRFNAVFFDLGYTLVDLEPFDELVSRLCGEAGVRLTVEEVAGLHAGFDREIAAFERAKGVSLQIAPPEDCQAFWLSLFTRVLDGSGRTYPGHLPQTLHEQLRRGECVQVYSDVVPALAALRTAGIQIGIISDWEAWAESMLLQLGLASLFDFVLISGVLGLEKPDPRLFRMALERAGVPAGRAVHVGDDPERDCEPARAIGITPVLLDREGRCEASAWLRMRHLGDFQDWFFG
jgi:putative hydrolase of the HAD superfamily